MYLYMYTGAPLAEGGGGLPYPFFKSEEKCPNLEKNVLIMFIYGLYFSFKMLF